MAELLWKSEAPRAGREEDRRGSKAPWALSYTGQDRLGGANLALLLKAQAEGGNLGCISQHRGPQLNLLAKMAVG